MSKIYKQIEDDLTPTSKYIKANGITQHYLDWGNHTAPPLLMVHATGLCGNVWNPYARVLSDNFHVICLNQRGHGFTDQPTGEYDFELVGQDVAAFIEELDFSEAYSFIYSPRPGTPASQEKDDIKCIPLEKGIFNTAAIYNIGSFSLMILLAGLYAFFW